MTAVDDASGTRQSNRSGRSATVEKGLRCPAPFSIRFSFEERARLDDERGNKPLSVYVRERLFGEGAAPRKKRGNDPLKDAEALGRVLGALGQSHLPSNLNQLARAANTGSLPVTPETEAELKDACRKVADLRADLLRALGRHPGDSE
ncbi:hypothetical protein LC092_03525 [Stappia stellulata]|uniref:hypothetical protein n=1 Tax=Stappia stellulata TaxID=71235 RepID=UPI001CD46ECF|nr:hypothetical protein [Stappia stellulata]MCA1241499.1 hypothetical protein [Stappia stellulata]